MSTSRSIVLYAAALGGWTWLAARRSDHRDAPLRGALPLALALLPAALALLWIAREVSPSLVLPGLSATADTLQRFFVEAPSNNVRLLLWREAAHGIAEAPWLGHGIGSAPWHYFTHAANWPAGQAAPVAEHVHNLPLQLMLEFGIPLALATLVLMAGWLLDFLRRPVTLARWWLLSIVGITTIHSLLEYPLWYLFFLGPFALLLGAADERGLHARPGNRGVVYSALILAVASLALGVLRADYGDMERLLNWRQLSGGRLDMKATIGRLLELQRGSMLAPQATVTFALMMEPTQDHLEDRRSLCQSALRFAPTERIAFKCALLDAMAGDPDAGTGMARAKAAFPEAAKAFQWQLNGMSGISPDTRRLLTP